MFISVGGRGETKLRRGLGSRRHCHYSHVLRCGHQRQRELTKALLFMWINVERVATITTDTGAVTRVRPSLQFEKLNLSIWRLTFSMVEMSLRRIDIRSAMFGCQLWTEQGGDQQVVAEAALPQLSSNRVIKPGKQLLDGFKGPTNVCTY